MIAPEPALDAPKVGRVSPQNPERLDGVRFSAPIGPVVERPQPPAPVALPHGIDVQRVTLPRGQNLPRPERVTVNAKLEVSRPGLEPHVDHPPSILLLTVFERPSESVAISLTCR